ncbi:MAG: hypothetical protein WCR06_04395 [bacterium]
MAESKHKLSWRSVLKDIGLIVAAWVFGLGGVAVLVAITAPHKQTMEPITAPFVVLLGLVCLALDAIGTYRLTRFIRNSLVRVLTMTLLVAVQCCLFFFSVVAIMVTVYIWAGGQI